MSDISPTIVIHGGLVVKRNSRSTRELGSKLKGIADALSSARSILQEGSSATAACVEAVSRLEDNPLFNAGTGSFLSSEGAPELEALIMDGARLRFGSVTGVSRIKNPIRLAEKLSYDKEVSSLIGQSAEYYAKTRGIELVDKHSLITKRAKSILWDTIFSGSPLEVGTVGAVAVDGRGCIAAATSSGGTPGKRPGRMSDTCMPGVGAYASNASAAIACTGIGETIMRLGVARDIGAMMEYGKADIITAAGYMAARIKNLGGSVAFIGIDRHGRVVFDGDEGMLPCGIWNNELGTRLFSGISAARVIQGNNPYS